jgi:hypothetical protein
LVNAKKYSWWPDAAVLLLAAVVLTASAWLRSAEYDEQYTLFLTAGQARPAWPETVFPAGLVAAAQAGDATLAGIARDLRASDVHPPLYFWAISLWRSVFGPGLFAARLFSVLCGVVSVGLVGVIARQCRAGAAAAMLVTLGCYGFVYTDAIARGFAPATLGCVAGVALLLGRRPVLAGVMLGAACCCNYLAVFVAAASVVAAGAWSSVLTAAPFLAVDAWFFAAQHGARPDQFAPFSLWGSLVRLAQYQVAAVFGGLPLYVDGAMRPVVGAAVGLLAVVVVARIALGRGSGSRVVLAAAAAPAVGLLLLGAVFDNTPIELRYFAFGLPFFGVLAGSALRRGRWMLAGVVCVQVAGVVGLLVSPETMQPARTAANEAAALVGDGVVLLPRGNDGVGIVGAFGIEAPPALPVLLVRPDEALRLASWHRVVLVRMSQDRDSRATVAMLERVLAGPNWRPVADGRVVSVYERTGGEGCEACAPALSR